MNLLSVFLISIKRLWSNKGLALCSALGLVIAVAIISSVPLYADAANYQVLRQKLAAAGGVVDAGDDEAAASGADAGADFVFMYRYIGAWHGAVDMDDFEQANNYITRSVPGVVDLPLLTASRFVKTASFSLFSSSDAAYIGTRQSLGWVNIGFMDDIQNHVQIVEGRYPTAGEFGDTAFEVLVSRDFVEETGLQPGEDYIVFRPAETGGGDEAAATAQWTVHIAGVWAATDPGERYWAYDQSVLKDTLVVPEETFRQCVAPLIDDEIYAAVWYMDFDGGDVRTAQVPGLISRVQYASTRVGTLLPNARLDVSPMEELADYRWTAFVMTILLYVFSIPVMGLVLYFIGMVSGLMVERQRGEIVMFKGRGASDVQVLGIYLVEKLLLGAVGLAGGLWLGRLFALVMGNTISFLIFGQRGRLPIEITSQVMYVALGGLAVSLLAALWPALRASRLTMVSYRLDRARSLQRPIWQRFGLDVLLIVPAGYGYYALLNRGTISFLSNMGSASDPFRDPLLFVAPSLAILAGSLVVVRFFPLLMELGAWLSSRFGNALALVLALRQLARVSRQYTGALLLLVLTLSLATFTASMALTLNRSLADSTYYRNGADYFLVERGEAVQPLEEATEDDEAVEALTGESESLGYTFVPVSEHLRVPGVTGATRVGSYDATAILASDKAQGQFYGIDRADFAKVAFFRDDFSSESLGEMMNTLAGDGSALLVSPEFLQDHNIKIGDRIEMTIAIYDVEQDIIFTVAGVISHFPTYYTSSSAPYLFVGNLEYVFEQMGGLYPYDVWIRTGEEMDPTALQAAFGDYDLQVTSIRDSRADIAAAQADSERTGIFGILSVGFVAAATLTVLGFVLYILVTFRRRYIEIGVLRAIGLTERQMIDYLAIEQTVLIVAGMTCGTALGVLVSRYFIPFLQVGSDASAAVPPFQVFIAWGNVFVIYGIFALMLLGTVGGMIWYLKRLKIFEAVKLGEAV